jgi:hypothetical protein
MSSGINQGLGIHEWSRRSWPQIEEISRNQAALAIIPVTAQVDWGFGGGLDFEEKLLLPILGKCLGIERDFDALIVPPVRFVGTNQKNSAFSMDLESSYWLLEEIAQSVAGSGFKRIVFCNLNPHTEDIIDVVGRETRIACNIAMFCVNLRALGVELSRPNLLTIGLCKQLLALDSIAKLLSAEVNPEPEGIFFPDREGVLDAPSVASSELPEDPISSVARDLAELFKEISEKPITPILKGNR